ncbi:MAG: hypothetical protein WCR21_11965 [Bacteroidota bacterium]
MLNKLDSAYTKWFWLLSALLTLLVALRAYLVPFSHDEVATFYFYIQPQSFLPFNSHVDANGHFLTNLSSWITYKLFGSSPFALRLPNIFAFVLLCYATFKTSQLLNGIFAKSILFFGFLAAYHFIAFYALCRGYALSMSFLLWALYHFFAYVKKAEFKHFFLFVIGAQLALAANLTLVFVLLICSGILILFQYNNKSLFKAKSILLWFFQFALCAFWVKYAFYLQHNGALYYGSGNNYWQVTFVSLIETIFFKSRYLNIVLLGVFGAFCVYWLYAYKQHRLRFITHSGFALSFLILVLLVLAFFFLKLLLNVNYPEDRTGLFFYLFFILALAFKVSEARYLYQKLSFVFPVFVLLHFIWHVNLTVHPWRIYETFPPRFMQTLLAEQKRSPQKITVAGHRLREFIYGFMNYNSGGELNHITSPEALQMNADYAIAYKTDAVFYRDYYDEIDAENTWGFVLLKRKTPIERELLFEQKQVSTCNGSEEFYNAFEWRDTSLANQNPLLAEFNLQFNQVPVPFNAWLVLQIDDASPAKANILVRVPLNLIRKNLHNQSPLCLHVLTGTVPKQAARVVAYIWNIDKKPMQVQITNFKLFRLNANGIQVVSQAKI